ncbi:hypothetical protein [Streptomyces himalayensis]|uniref:hypothetical protein n=1 Tax=Streptomyces himalayensis TaxID=2820085 RepID=UPI001C6A0D93|nr:hypothetical protein [Streptomyces himalayensis]
MHGFVAESDAQARSTYLEYEHRMMAEGMAELGRPAPSRADRAANYGPDGMVFVGSPDEIADRILHLHGLLGHTRQILQMDGGMPQRDFLRGIELLGAKVLPQMVAVWAGTVKSPLVVDSGWLRCGSEVSCRQCPGFERGDVP